MDILFESSDIVTTIAIASIRSIAYFKHMIAKVLHFAPMTVATTETSKAVLARTSLKDDEVNAKRDLAQRLLIMRHAERVDFTFGDWVPFCFDIKGKYIRRDLNLPISLPNRALGPRNYIKDCPITQVGMFQSTLVGEALRESNITLRHVYSSPAFRCVQTCDAVLRGLGCELKIKIEPGLFECLAFYHNGLPSWFQPGELLAAGYNINTEYIPIIKPNDLLETEDSLPDYRLRSEYVTKAILNQHTEGDILFVAHATSLDVCSRKLLHVESDQYVEKVPYCSLVSISKKNGVWNLVEPPCLPITHSENDRFNWRILNF